MGELFHTFCYAISENLFWDCGIRMRDVPSREDMISFRSDETAMQQIARTRSWLWFSIAFKKAPDRGSQIQQVAVFIGDKDSEICTRKLPRSALNTAGS
jgi:hypothetical protein